MLKDTSYALLRRLSFIETAIQEYVEKQKNPPIVIADIGCGTGELLTIPLSIKLGKTSTIYAYEPEILTFRNLEKRVKELGIQNIQPIQNKESLQNQIYDVIIVSEVIEHVKKPIAFINNLKYKLKPFGIMIITTPNGFGIFEIETMLFNTLELVGIINMLRKIKKGLFQTRNSNNTSLNADTLAISPHINFFTLRDLHQILAEVGLSLKKIEGKHFAAGPFSDRILNKSKKLVELNAKLGKKFPLVLVAGWMLVAENKENRSAQIEYSDLIKGANIFRRWYSKYKRLINVHAAHNLEHKKKN